MRTELLKSEDYIKGLYPTENASKLLSRQAALDLGLEKISLSVAESKLLTFIISQHQCKKFIEIGTLTGLSGQYILDGLGKGGKLWTFEKSPLHAEKAQSVFNQLPDREALYQDVFLMLGNAEQELDKISTKGPFDGIFIDGNKSAYGKYLDWAESHIKPGGLIVADNVFLFGTVWGQQEKHRNLSEKTIQSMRNFNLRLADQNKYCSSLIPTTEGMFLAKKLF